MPRCCRTCRFYQEEWDGGDDPDLAFGDCIWSVPVPHAWRWCLRERVGVYPSEGSTCPCHEYRPSVPEVISPSL